MTTVETNVVPETTPVVETPAPAVETPAPAAETPAVAPETPAPAPAAEAESQPYEITAPEGIEVDPVQLSEFTAFANELKIPKDKAEAFSHSFAKKQLEKVQQTIAGWRKEAETDAEIGGENFQKNVDLANKTFEKYGSVELKKVLAQTGLANHKELVRWAYRVGKAAENDSVPTGGAVANSGPASYTDAFAAVIKQPNK